MTKQLSDEDIIALSNYRMQRAKETLAEISNLRDMGYYNTAINRLYYACYYASVALLVRQRINATTHAGVKQMLGLHFVSKQIISREAGRVFGILFDRRHSSDYDDFAYSSFEEVNELLPMAEAFINEIEELLQKTNLKS
ncbi:MAG: HEPN domain-containing protein [Prevotella sp.]|nr:HEPN domain-containing protein [Prevotella sp.]